MIMYFFYFYFVISYCFYSTVGLIIDIFFNEHRIDKLDINLIKDIYSKAYDKVSTNVLLVSIPFFIFTELIYINYTYNTSLIVYTYEYIITILFGINLDYIINLLKHSSWFYKYHKEHHGKKELFGFMCYDQNKYDFCLSMIVVIFPALFRFSPEILQSWIMIYLYTNIILNYCNLHILGTHFNIHHNILHFNYGFILIDYILDTILVDKSFVSNDKSNDESNDESNDDESNAVYNDESNDDLERSPYYRYITHPSNSLKQYPIKVNMFGKLHYSNFF